MPLDGIDVMDNAVRMQSVLRTYGRMCLLKSQSDLEVRPEDNGYNNGARSHHIAKAIIFTISACKSFSR